MCVCVNIERRAETRENINIEDGGSDVNPRPEVLRHLSKRGYKIVTTLSNDS